MTRKGSLVGLLLALGCSSPTNTPGAGSPQPEPVLFPGDTTGCVNVQQVCLETSPPQCFPYCADEPPKKGLPCTGEGDIQTCGGSQCVVGQDKSGQTFELCANAGCVVSYEASTGTETITCGGSDAGADGGDAGVAGGGAPDGAGG